MSKHLGNFALGLLILSLITAFFHFMLMRGGAVALSREDWFEMHAFLVGITFASYLLLFRLAQNSPDKVGFAFLGAGVLKMAASVLYLLPWLRGGEPNAKSVALQFFAGYFIYLFYEARAVYKLSKKTTQQIEEHPET